MELSFDGEFCGKEWEKCSCITFPPGQVFCKKYQLFTKDKYDENTQNWRPERLKECKDEQGMETETI